MVGMGQYVILAHTLLKLRAEGGQRYGSGLILRVTRTDFDRPSRGDDNRNRGNQKPSWYFVCVTRLAFSVA